MEKNQQVLEFERYLSEIDKTLGKIYSIDRRIFLEFLEFMNEDWESYKKFRSKKEILGDIKYFTEFYYLPF